MCVILDTPQGVDIPLETLELGHSNNPHGFGIFFPTKQGKVHVHKIMPEKFDDVRKVWELYKNYDAPKSVHFRLKTKGEIDRTNVHPFRVLSKNEHGREIWVMHNGTIHDAPSVLEEKSDTWHFVTYILRPILAEKPELVEDPDFHALIEAMLKGDRMLLLDGETSKTIRLNSAKSGGHVTKEGIWVSNDYGLKDYHNYYGNWGSGQSGVVGFKDPPKKAIAGAYNAVNLTGTTVKVWNEHRTLIEQRYDRGAKLECMREITEFFKDGNVNELDLRLRFSIKNTGTLLINRVALRTELDKVLGDKFSNIRIIDYKVRGQLTPTISFGPAYRYANQQHNDYLNPSMGGVIEIKLAAKFDGTDEEFKELSTIDLQRFYVEVGYATAFDIPDEKDFVIVDKDNTLPWENHGEEDDISDEDAAALADAMEEDDWEDGEGSVTTERRKMLDDTEWYVSDGQEDDNGIVYYNFNANPDWEMDFDILNRMTHEELMDACRHQPEYIADFLKEFLDAF
jgi:hypothetical protein